MLTNLLLLIVVTGGFLYGLRLMRGLDRFLAENGRETRQRETEQEYAVIFGIRQEAELEKWFEAAGIQTVFITDVHMERSGRRSDTLWHLENRMWIIFLSVICSERHVRRQRYTASVMKKRSKSCTDRLGRRCFTTGKSFFSVWS